MTCMEHMSMPYMSAASQAGLNTAIANPSALIKPANSRRTVFPLRLPLSTLLPSSCWNTTASAQLTAIKIPILLSDTPLSSR